MSDAKLEAAIAAVQKPQERGGLVRALIALRKEVEWPKNRNGIGKLRESGCLKLLTDILRSSGVGHCLNLALSILGNCLMDRACSREVVVQYNILTTIKQLLKKHPKEDSVNGRLFRIVANLCQHRDLWANIIIDRKPQIVNHIVRTLERTCDAVCEKMSDATISMALKALRELLNSQTVMRLVKDFGVLRVVGRLLIKCSLELDEKRGNERLLLDVLKVVQEYSRYKCPLSIPELRGTGRGDALARLGSAVEVAPRRVVKIVMNFLQLSQHQSELPVPEICGYLIRALKSYSVTASTFTEFDAHNEYLRCLCLLLDDPANRTNGRCGQSVPVLVKVLRDYEEPSNAVLDNCVLLVATLAKFRYDERLLWAQIRCGVVDVLVEKLRWLVGSSSELDLRHEIELPRDARKPRPASLHCYRESDDDSADEAEMSSCSDDDTFRWFEPLPDRKMSPCSSPDSLRTTSWSSPGTSTDDDDVDDSDEYSPVCSEAGGSPRPEASAEDDDLPLLEKFEATEAGDVPANASTSDRTLRKKLFVVIGSLLRSYAKLALPASDLVGEQLLLALLECARLDDYAAAVGLICSIFSHHGYLLPAMETKFAERAYRLTRWRHAPQRCRRCKRHLEVGQPIVNALTALAESGGGKGEIAHRLLTGADDRSRELVALAVPYVVGNASLLATLLLKCGGLDILTTLLRRDADVETSSRAVEALHTVAAHKLRIANPRSGPPPTRPPIIADAYAPPPETGVVFVLDDGARVVADRDFLASKSDFFRLLLTGDHFLESGAKEISLPQVAHKTLRCLLHLLINVRDTDTVEVHADLDTVLDVILLCDRFLLVGLCVALTTTVERFAMCPRTVPKIYGWSLESRTNFLRVEAIAYALVAEVDEEERRAMFDGLRALGRPDDLVEDVERLFVRHLTLGHADRRAWTSKHSKRVRLTLPPTSDNF
ncbi:armadillo repeat-containing protein 5-like [Cylas formicarius]|uniref:armadillo repeat-containing protein 5-like n=1 Tax=Cylas formicarius TaxID=197179 RepID=UPI0029583E18|nr:armadillo repeat-containing protein 5-like [Cylas formicarius]